MTYQAQMTTTEHKVAVVIPCFRVKAHVLNVLRDIDATVSRIYVVDDCCPDESGRYVTDHCSDPRVTVIRLGANQGVGGAVMTGYKAALEDGMTIIVKIDGDGQMDPRLLPDFIGPILAGEADYTKGNRFFDLEKISAMPRMRLFGNAVLSFMTKLSSGYWNIFDPTNGYTAIHCDVARHLPLDKISRRYFFETDMLFRLNTLRAVVVDVPMDAHYGDEVSNLHIRKILGEFLAKHCRNLIKRIFYNYYLRDISLASLQLPLGSGMLAFGSAFGLYHWWQSAHANTSTPTGTVMLAVLPVLLGMQFLLAFLGHDIGSVPTRPFQRRHGWTRHPRH